jgi:hypothetical protein
MPPRPNVVRTFFMLLIGTSILGGFTMNAHAQGDQARSNDRPSTIEYYYKVKWGFADEFIRLFKKNHYPVLKKQIDMGRILQVTAVTPRFHNTEDGRWDYRMTIVFKNAKIAFSDFDSDSLNREIFPDQETFKKEEQRRFEILLAHWDLPVTPLDLEKK